MHLGLIERPFVPHNLIPAQESPVPLPQFQMAPRFKILMSSVFKKGTQIYFYLSLKKSRKTNPLRFPNRGLYGERYPFTGYFCISLENLIKISLNKKFFFSQKALRKGCPSMFPPKRGPYGNRRFGVPNKGALPPGSPHTAPTDRCSVSTALLHSSFKVPGIRAPFRIPGSAQP
jgi:hypothetical protein